MGKIATAASSIKGLKALREIEVRFVPTGLKVPAKALGPIMDPNDAADIFKAVSDRRTAESLMAVYLDSRHRPVAVYEAARGAGNVVHVSPRDLLVPALVTGSNAMIIAHNHPSGDATPSREDAVLTERIKSAGELVGVPLLDHIVVGEEDYYSFTEGRTVLRTWEKGKSYSAGGWGSALAITGAVGVLLLAILPFALRRGKATTLAGLDFLGAAE
jgi:DNA repair protein RadC